MVHNHGPEEGKGLACKERLIGECLLAKLKETILSPRIHNAMAGDIRIPDFAHEIWADVEKII